MRLNYKRGTVHAHLANAFAIYFVYAFATLFYDVVWLSRLPHEGPSLKTENSAYIVSVSERFYVSYRHVFF